MKDGLAVATRTSATANGLADDRRRWLRCRCRVYLDQRLSRTHHRFICFLQINELKKVHQAGGRSVFTWEKQPNDKYVAAVGAVLVTFGLSQLIPGYYRLATGKGKMD